MCWALRADGIDGVLFWAFNVRKEHHSLRVSTSNLQFCVFETDAAFTVDTKAKDMAKFIAITKSNVGLQFEGGDIIVHICLTFFLFTFDFDPMVTSIRDSTIFELSVPCSRARRHAAQLQPFSTKTSWL